MTTPQDTERVVRDCVEAGVRRVWMHRGGGQGAVSKEAADFCHKHGIHLVEGYCPFMFLPHTQFVHRVHRFVLKLLGRYPAELEGAFAPACASPAATQQDVGTKTAGTKGRRFGPALTIVLVAAAVVALVNHRYRQDLRAAQERVASGSTLIPTACGPIEYADVGTGASALVIHGAGGGFDQALEFGRPLVANGFRVIAPSRFGYLRTPLPADASPRAQAEAHRCLLDSLKVDKVVVFGGSAGAPSAIEFCLGRRERCSAMILAVPLVYSDRPAGRAPAQLSRFRKFLITTTLRSDFAFWAMSKLAHATTIKTILATPPGDVEMASSEEQGRIEQILNHIAPISRREKGLENDAAIAGSLPHYDLERFVVPTLVISVEDDLFNTYSSARYTGEHIPGARFVRYPTGAHLWVGHQPEVWSEVANFLKNAPQRKSQ